MSSLLPISLALFILAILYTYVIHPLLIHPLSRIPPAHRSAPLSTLWISRHRRNGSQALHAIKRAHEKYGPVVRLAPNEVSVATEGAARRVYVDRGGWGKPAWWAGEFETFGVRNMVSMIGGPRDKSHALRKKDHGNVYSKTYLLTSSPLQSIAESVLARLVKRLDHLVERENGIMDVYGFHGAVNADFMSSYLFGKGTTDFLEDGEAREEYFKHHGVFLKGQDTETEGVKWLEGMTRGFCAEAAGTAFEKHDPNDGGERRGQIGGKDDAVVYRQLHSRGITGDDLASELLDHFIAGAEAPRTILTYLQWELCKHPHIQNSLRDELRTLSHTSTSTSTPGVPPLKSLTTLPLLDAILTETLRLYTPTPGPQYRVAPPEGAVLEGYFIPGGTGVSASLAVLHREESVFKDAGVWRPERWLDKGGDKDGGENNARSEEMKRWFWAFMKGSRGCIGKDFTMIVMKLIVYTVYVRYRTEVVEDDGMEMTDRFLAQPEGGKLVLRFERVG
ncbi:cytochrome P450 [Byssothecium circinans]|uniref:Cytochrome P450 n=1 Tax=Byssothecium circinans TaxID=147558 RepID=A0A6A5UDE0_9PLEO|nr:cytochrome P450 [Byssothecium circinans]